LSVPSGFPTNILHAILISSMGLHPSRLILLHLTIIKYSIKPTSYAAPHYGHFFPLRTKYSPQFPVLKQPQSMLLTSYDR
jgi:hypothetical protein